MESNNYFEEALRSIEDQLAGEDKGWVNLSLGSGSMPAWQKIDIIKRSRHYALIDPIATQGLRLWTDYSFGTGISWRSEDERVSNVMKSFWEAKENKPLLSSSGQRKLSRSLLVDGVIYYAIFLGAKGKMSLRKIEPLEITEEIANPDDALDIRYYKREWIDYSGEAKSVYYRSYNNKEDNGAKDRSGNFITATSEALVYKVETETGYPLLTSALDWIKLYRQFLGSRVAIILALARFAWKQKTTDVATAKSKLQSEYPEAGSVLIENIGSDMTPIKQDTGASGAYQDGRTLKLQICAALGIPEQYFGDVSVGSLATARTTELPLIKMFQSYQSVWLDTFNNLIDILMSHNNIKEYYVDIDFPEITPEQESEVAKNIAALMPHIPELAYSDDVLQQALMSIGVKNVNKAIELLKSEDNKESVEMRLAKVLREFEGSISERL